MFMKTMFVELLLSFAILTVGVSVRAGIIVENLGQPTQNYAGPIGRDDNKHDFLIAGLLSRPQS